jgi:hypothetical protein
MIKYAQEMLTHFKCDVCNNWWAIGDWVKKDSMTCPHCHTCQNIEEDTSI